MNLDKHDALVGTLLIAALIAWLVPVATLGVDQHHDGVMLKPALDVLSGQTLFRDTFTQYGALSTYLQVAVLWFSPTLAALRLMTVGAYAVSLGFLYAAWRQVLPRSLAVAAGGLFILFLPVYEKNWQGANWLMIPWSSVYALMFQSIAIFSLGQVIAGSRVRRWAVLLGAACAGVFWCRQPVGIITTGTVALTMLALFLARWRPANSSWPALLPVGLGGFFGVNLLLLGGIVLSGATEAWWYQNFIWPSRWAQSGSEDARDFLFFHFIHVRAGAALLALLLAVAAPSLLARFGLRLTRWQQGLYYLLLLAACLWQQRLVLRVLALREGGWSLLLPLLVLALALMCLVAVCRRKETWTVTEYQLAALAALSAASLTQYYPLPDPWHTAWALAPTFGVAVHVLWRASGWSAGTTTLALLALLLPAVVKKSLAAPAILAEPVVRIERPAVLRGMRTTALKADAYQQVGALLEKVEQKSPGRPAALSGNDALFLCLAGNLANPTPYYVTWPGLADASATQARWNWITAVRPVMLLHKAQWAAVNDFYRRARYRPVLYVESEALEVALPEELADGLGLGLYGTPLPPKP
jgi:hypothetical protein